MRFIVPSIALLTFCLTGCNTSNKNYNGEDSNQTDKDKIDELLERIDELQKELASCQTSISALENDINEYLSQIASLNNQIASLNESNEALEEQISTLNQQIALNQQTISSLNQQIASLNEQIESLNSIIDELQSELDSYNVDYTITFDFRNGNPIITETHKAGEYLTEPESPSKEGYQFIGWFDDTLLIDFTMYKVTKETTIYAKWKYICDDDTVVFGNYPQTEITSESLSLWTQLNLLIEHVPTQDDSYGWTPHTSWNETTSNFMWDSSKEVAQKPYRWFKDVEYGGDRYRALYFTHYEGQYSGYTKHTLLNYVSGNCSPYSSLNGYSINTVYWFKFEPIVWKNIEYGGNRVFVSTKILDCGSLNYSSSVVDNNDLPIIPSIFSNSKLDNFLNGSFFDNAFSEEEKSNVKTSIIKNGISTTSVAKNPYAYGDTNSHVYSLSYSEYKSKQLEGATFEGTAYARCIGLRDDMFWLRSAYSLSEISTVKDSGTVTKSLADQPEVGNLPVIQLGD